MPEVSFNLNGHPTTISYEAGMHFLDVLRECCGITSAKDGCAPQGVCGCCTILINGKPSLACQLDPAKADGSVVVTLEGLPERQRQLLAAAFVREGAVQCGFCTPGIAMRAAHLINKGLTEDRSRVERGLAGHLCRCTGYNRIVDAIQTAGEAAQGISDATNGPPRRPHHFGEDYGLERSSEMPRDDGVGASSKRYRGQDQTLGARNFVADMTKEGMLHGALVLSDHPRATVLRIETSKASLQPGVERILTAEDVPGVCNHGLLIPDWPLLVTHGETTRYIGDVLAVVVADSQHHARMAADAVEVVYEVLDPVASPEAALAADAPLIHPGGNLLGVCSFSRGSVDTALDEAAFVVDETFTTQRIEHAFLEPEASLAVPTDDGGLKIWSQGQGVHDDQLQVAAILGIDRHRVEVELVSNGGAFGGKEDLSVQGHAALAAWLLQRPVRVVLTREQSMRIHPKRHPITLHYTVGADADGRLTAVRADIVGDTGAYASVGTKVLERAAGHSCGPYRVPNVDVEARTVYTNNPPCGAMRGFGANQAAFAIEGILDILAEKIGIDCYDIRERNILDPGDRFATGQLMTSSCGIRQTLEAVRDIYKRSPRAGIACGIKNTGIGNGMEDIGRVAIEVLEDGRLEVLTGYTEMGQGLHTILRQVVCQETGLPPDIMAVRTNSGPDIECGMTTASRATALCTAAGQIAARQLAGALTNSSLEELIGRRFHGEFICDFTTAPNQDVEEPVTHMAFGFATQVVILAEDGTIERVVAAHDVGRAINPLLCAGQIEGGVHMGLGYALSEDFPCTEGRPDSLLMRDLGILRAAHTPTIDVILVEVPDAVGGYGSKGVGEIGLVPTAGAVAGALYAHDGIRRTSLPMADSPAAQSSLPRSRKHKQ
ncbi:MAG: selenium-dependent xanthine dehydrogenase [Acidobacteriota bacterium]|jgi:xanthine dehydrogenase molybdenum-binding subunit|nr:selenium-dependent xanthine dehydrogenase [Acidobacteriota bacterium]